MKRSSLRQRTSDFEREFRAVRPLIEKRSRGLCEANAAEGCTGIGVHVHHRRLRSQGGSNHPANLLHVCSPCHEAIHAHPARSYDNGWLLRTGGTDGWLT